MIYRKLTAVFLIAVAAQAAPVRAGDIDRFLPADTEIIVTVKAKELVDTPIFKQNLLEPARDALKSVDELQGALDSIGFDPFTDLDKVIIAGPGGAAQDKVMVVAHGHYELEKITAKGEESAKGYPDHLKMLKIKVGADERIVYEVNLPESDTAFYICFVSKNTLLFSYNKEYVLGALKNVDPRSKAVLTNKILQTAAEQVNPRQTITVAASGSALARFELPEGLRGAAGKLEALAGGITLGDDLRVDLVMQCGTEQQAREVVRSINDSVTAGIVVLSVLARKEERYAPLVEMVKSVHARQKDKTATVTVKAEVSADLLGKLLKGL